MNLEAVAAVHRAMRHNRRHLVIEVLPLIGCAASATWAAVVTPPLIGLPVLIAAVLLIVPNARRSITEYRRSHRLYTRTLREVLTAAFTEAADRPRSA